MWNLFKNWFFSRALNRHRLLFRFWNGSRFVSVDPFIILRKLLKTDKFDPDADLKKLEIPDAKIITEKIGFIAEGVREIFDLPAFEAGGLTELECVQLLMEFSGFLENVKKNGAQNLITLPSSPTVETPVENGSVVASDTNENSASI